MNKNEKKVITSAKSAQAEDNINAEKSAEVSTPQTGDKESFAAGSTRDKDKEFDALIENEYKEQFSKKVQKIISKRLREVKNLKEENVKNAENKDEILRRLALENRLLKKRHEDEFQLMKLRSEAQKMREQAAETKEVYPEFDFEKFKRERYVYEPFTNFVEVFESPEDMKGLQQLVDQYLEKPFG